MAISVPSESSGKVAPKAKQQQDEAIIGTNDYSIMSKRSVEKLYYNDEPEFLRAFVHRFKRRAPLVNRGYWLRMRAIEAVVQRFLNENTSEKKAVVNLGCGYDPLAFRTLWKYPTQSHDVKFVDVDFPSLIAKKVQIIKNESCLRSQLNPADENPSHTAIKYANSKYCAVGCDLGDIDLLEYILKDHLNLDDFSVLFINEVAMVYMLPHEATDVVSLCSSFADARFCMLGYCFPAGSSHPFARNMDEHYRRTPLRDSLSYPTKESQRDRFRGNGWAETSAADLWTIWQSDSLIPSVERKSLDAVEPFDEWEGLALWGAHSVLLLAATKDAHTTSRTWFKELIPSIAMDETPQSARVKVQIGTTPLPRLHRRTQGAMYQPQADVLVHYGGTTFDSRQGSGDIYCSSECKPAKVSLPPNSLNYATITSTGSNSFLLVGGRTSPSRASSACFLYEDGDWTPVAELVPGRYRHSAAQVSVNGRDGVLVFGGKTSDGTVLNTWSLFINNEWHDLFIAGDVPPPLFGAALIATTLMQGLLAGGLNQNGRLQSNSSTVGFWHWIIDENSDRLFRVRTTSVPCFHPNESSSSSVARFGATAVNTVSGVLLIGGIGPQGPLRPEEETILLKLDGTVVPHEPVLHGTEALPMFIGHNVMKTADDDIIVAGGGMVCFSHGVFWNDSIHHLTFGNTNAKTGGTWNLVTDGSKSSDVVPHAPDRKAYKQILAQGLAATSNEPTKPLAGAPLQRLSTLAAIGKHISRSTSRPFVLEGLNLGPCTEQWSSDGLKARVGRDKATIIHAAASPHLSFHAKNFKYTTVDFASFINAAIAGEHVYMRALSTEKPSNTPASLVSDYPLLAQDFKIPVELSFADEHQHSSVLRISGHVNMWLHYDVMSNILCQIKGSKRIILFPPSDVSRLDFPPGETTSNIDVFRSERDRFEGCSSMETILSAGEVLFIPACWPHATAPATRANGLDQELSVAVNVFFKSLEDKFYAVGRDVYGNRDLEMYQNGRKHVGHIVRLLSGVDAKERSAKLAAHAQALKTQTWSIHEKYGGKEANRILTSARDLPTDLAQFYLHRLADELQYA